MRAVIPSIRLTHSPVARTTKAPNQRADLVLKLLNRSRDLSQRHRSLLREAPKRQESCGHRAGAMKRQFAGSSVDIGTITERRRNRADFPQIGPKPRGCSYTNLCLSVQHDHLKPLSAAKALKSLATSLRQIASHRLHSKAA